LLIRRDTSAVPGTRPSTPAIIQQLDCSRLRTPVRVGSAIDVLDNIELENVGSMNELATPWCSEGTRSLHPAAQQLLARGARPRSPISRPGRSSLVHSGVQPLAARGSVDSLRFGGPAKPRASLKALRSPGLFPLSSKDLAQRSCPYLARWLRWVSSL
jgi:hypothetical protein